MRHHVDGSFTWSHRAYSYAILLCTGCSELLSHILLVPIRIIAHVKDELIKEGQDSELR